MFVQTFLFFTVIFSVAVVRIQGQECIETAECEYGFVPMKLCGKWACYSAYNEIHPAWRGYWGVTHVCENTYPGTYGLSIHCPEENKYAQETYGMFYTGLHIPENIPWDVKNFRWTDGSPLDFTDWAPPGHGSPAQQPDNGTPGHAERVVIFTNHWHDIVHDPSIKVMACKKPPLKMGCRKVAAAPPPPPPPACTEKVTCEYGFIPQKLCGKWACYGAYSEIHPDWRGYWGVTHVCEWTFPGSYGLSIHCPEENKYAQETYGVFYTGLHIPENIPWDAKNFRWTDGSPLDFTDWAPPGHGSPAQQPDNGTPGHTERVVVFTNHWHDMVHDPSIKVMACKKVPVSIETVCPTTLAPPEMETIQMDDVPNIPIILSPSNDSKPSKPIRSCKI